MYISVFLENGIRLTTYKSNRPGRPKVAWSSFRGGPSRKALSVMGPAILASEGVFPPDKKEQFGRFWIQTAEYELTFFQAIV